MKKFGICVLVLLTAVMMAQADVVSDYLVKVIDGSPSYPDPITDAYYPSLGSTATWGTSGGNFQLYYGDWNTGEPKTMICNYSDGSFTVTPGSPSVMQIAGGGGNWISSPTIYNDYSTGNQLVRCWSITGGWGSDTNNPGWGGRMMNTFYGVAIESTGVTFTTPTRVTIVNTSIMHVNPIGNNMRWHGFQHMLNGGYLGMDQDDMWDLAGLMTSLRSLPGDLWENIDESQDIGTWYSAFGQPDDDHYNFGGGGILRLCDNTFASPQAGSSPWLSGGGTGIGLWINTVADSLPGNIPCWDGWRNDPNNTTTRSIDIMLVGESSYTSLAGISTTTQGMYPGRSSSLSLKPRNKDTCTQWLSMYNSIWPSQGLGWFKLMITKQKGDLNYDGKCDFSDLPLFSSTFNKSLGDAGYNGDADFNGDNKVDFSDLPSFSGVFGSSCQ